MAITLSEGYLDIGTDRATWMGGSMVVRRDGDELSERFYAILVEIAKRINDEAVLQVTLNS